MQDIQKRVVSGYQFIIQKKKEEKETNRCHFGDSDTYAPFSVANEEESPEEVLEKTTNYGPLPHTSPRKFIPACPNF